MDRSLSVDIFEGASIVDAGPEIFVLVESQSMQSGMHLNRFWLTLLILGSTAIPVGSAVLLSLAFPTRTEPDLDARVRLDAIWIEDSKNPGQQKLVPAITVFNPTSDSWKQLSIGLNKTGRNNQFYASEPAGVAAGKTISIPLAAFIARNGSVNFPAGSRPVKEVTIFAKLPNHDRGVAEFLLPDKPTVPKSGEPEEESWVHPLPRKASGSVAN